MDKSKKKSESSLSSSVALIVLVFVIILLVVVIIRLYTTYTSDYVEKSYVDTFYIEKTLLAFSDLPQTMQNLYTTRSQDDRTQKRMNQNIEMIEKSTIFSSQNQDILFLKQLECDKFIDGAYDIPSNCRVFLTKEFGSLDDSMIFEIIPMVNAKDFEFFRLLIQDNSKSDILKNREGDINNFIEYANAGLSNKRMNEAVWLLKQQFGNKVNIRQSSFHMFTKDKAGFVIKVFNNIK